MTSLGEKQLLEHTRETGSAARKWVLATVAVITDPPRGIMCTTDGSIVMEDIDGTSIDVAVTAGQFYGLSPSEVTSITDAVVWLLY